MKKVTQALLLLLFTSQIVSAQLPARPTLKEIKTQELYIKANKEKVAGNLDKAELLFNDVIKKDSKNDAAHYELARLHISNNNLKKANENIQAALAIAPDNIWYNTMQADLFVDQEKYKEAAEVFNHLTTIAPEEIGFRFELAMLYSKTGKPDQAIKIYNDIEDRMGVNAETSQQKHRLYLGMNKTAKAAQELEKLTAAFPLETDYMLMLGEHHEKTGDAEKAKEVYQKILTIEPQNPVANLAMAEDYHASGEDAKYLNALQGIFNNPEVSIDVKIQEIIPYINLVAEKKDDKNLAKEALVLTKMLTTTHPDEAKAFAVHGDMLNHASQPEEALRQYESAVKLNSSIFSVWEQMFFLQSDLDKMDDLQNTTEEAMDLFPNQPTAYFFNGVANERKANYTLAIDSYQQALMMSGRNEQMKQQIYVQLGSAYYNSSNFKKSDDYFEKALAINADDALALNNYSFYLAERGANLEKAEEMAAKANKLAPDTPSFLDTYGWVLYKRKKYKQAKELIAEALEKGGSDRPGILENYGDVLFQLNNIDEAVKYWQKAQDKGGNSASLSKKIENRMLE